MFLVTTDGRIIYFGFSEMKRGYGIIMMKELTVELKAGSRDLW